jgi:hypothetical protein
VNREYVLKLIAVIGALFVAFLWSGGVWGYSSVQGNLRHNKITGTTQYMEYTSDGWKDVGQK